MPKLRVKLKESRWYLDGVAASFLVLALTQQTVSFHVVAWHRHGLHYMEAVTVKHVKVSGWIMLLFRTGKKDVKTESLNKSFLLPILLGHISVIYVASDVSVRRADALAANILKVL